MYKKEIEEYILLLISGDSTFWLISSSLILYRQPQIMRCASPVSNLNDFLFKAQVLAFLDNVAGIYFIPNTRGATIPIQEKDIFSNFLRKRIFMTS